MSEFKFVPKPFVIKPCSKKEIRTYLEISKHIFNKWIKTIAEELGDPVCGLYSPKQVQFIIESFGPSGYLIREASTTIVENNTKEKTAVNTR